ncbi:MAG: hypothetical protein ACJ76H_11200 [Bacteriovoracaceae bacterium]
MKLFFLLTFLSCSLYAQEEAWKKICEQSGHIEDPYVTKEELKDCSSYDLYYGIKQKQDFEAARKCAYYELAHGDEQIFGGSSMLMMIYANGNGTKKDIDLALKYACHLEAAPAEMEGRIRHLAEIRNKKAHFDLCDDITSGFMQGHCTQVVADLAREKRRSQWKEILKRFDARTLESFHDLETAASFFIDERTRNEIDLSGTARAAFMIEEQDHLETKFQERVAKLEKGTFPADVPENDKILNETFEALMKKKFYGTLKPEGIRKTQESWLAYREAWSKFASKKYPKARGELTKTLNAERIQQLKDLLEMAAH